MTDTQDGSSLEPMLRVTAQHLKEIKLHPLIRPAVGPNDPPTRELIDWAIQAYCFPWIRHMGELLAGVVVLLDTGNLAAVRVVGRSSYEFCAHAYYVKKHVKQHLDAGNLQDAREFLDTIGTGSRYISEFHSHPGERGLFPVPPHISKAVKCFINEVAPKESADDYSYLSEYCHPNTMTFQQHYHWTNPYTIEFAAQDVCGALGTIAASSINGLVATHDLLALGKEPQVKSAVARLLLEIAKYSPQ